ncbi:MAG: methyltransferase domain-containing protein [Anaerolineae bacterium]|nr:methyltransferase domain-containing protein [Anaerolineae bacterium]
MGSARMQRGFWDLVYDRLARWYDAVDWLTGGTTHRLRQIALPHLPPPPARILEIGYGSGRLHVELVERYAMAGLDRAPGMARLTRRRLVADGRTPVLCVGDAGALPWPARAFDAVISTFALSAIPDAARAIDEMARVTRPGGRVIVVDAGEAMDGNRAARLLAALWSAMGDYMRDERPYMSARGLQVARRDAGPWGCVHVVVGTLPA